MSRTIKLTEQDIRNIVRESLKNIINEVDRHRPGYWAERWAKQKAEVEKERMEDKPSNRSVVKKKDRHRPGYYKEYNMKHPERLNRGYTKGYINGNVSDGSIVPPNDNVPYDNFAAHLRRKEFEWHDDDWYEGMNDDY